KARFPGTAWTVPNRAGMACAGPRKGAAPPGAWRSKNPFDALAGSLRPAASAVGLCLRDRFARTEGHRYTPRLTVALRAPRRTARAAPENRRLPRTRAR